MPVELTCSAGSTEGYTLDISGYGALIQSLKGLPVLGEQCLIRFYLASEVEATATVVRIDRSARQFAVETDQLLKNGEFYLAFLLL